MIVPNNSPDNSQATNLLYPGLLDSKDVVLQTVLEGLPQDKGHWTTFQNRLVSFETTRKVSKNRALDTYYLSFSLVSIDRRSLQ